MSLLILAFAIGFVTGLRTFTGLAALLLTRGPVVAVLGVISALIEFRRDLLPNTPSRTERRGIILRIVSGGFCGWLLAGNWGGSPFAGMAAGIAGAIAGAYAGHAARIAAIARIGAIPAALAEDAVAIGLAAFIITR